MRTHTLSYSEPNLWRNGFLRRFGSFAWRKRRGSHLELSARSPPVSDTARHPSVQEEASRTPEPLSEWAERVFEEYLTLGASCPTTAGGLGGLRFGSSLGESTSEHIGGAAASPRAERGPQAAGAGSAAPPPQDASKVCYAVVITLTKAEEEDGRGGPAGSGGEQGQPCHTPGEAALSLGVAERERAAERRHQKPAQPAPRLPAHKECQNCRGLLPRVGTSQVCRLVPAPATGSLVTRREGSEPRRRQSEAQSGSEQQHSRDGGLAGAPCTVGPESLASSCILRYIPAQELQKVASVESREKKRRFESVSDS
ncbi:hypothetical protein lerEdw1_009533 [Lerista edwardsae]|nr:hypothetical protein lerEdw1_009533 [Lerista edwardsae]